MTTIREVMSTDMVQVTPSTTVAEAATIMSTKKVGSALVMEGKTLVGIFTERDVLRAVASEFDAEHHQVGSFMTAEPTTIGPDADTHEGLSSMFAFGFRHMPVVEGGQVIGVVSMRDLTPHEQL
jgi:CBS domain-containing protein